jgi:prepilin signal peptidase PulO-like enzyme (type II secretory pathway)
MSFVTAAPKSVGVAKFATNARRPLTILYAISFHLLTSGVHFFLKLSQTEISQNMKFGSALALSAARTIHLTPSSS